jgi:hypothetical protein
MCFGGDIPVWYAFCDRRYYGNNLSNKTENEAFQGDDDTLFEK